MFFTCFALATLLVVLAMAIEASRGLRLLQRLDTIEPVALADLPRVSLIVAARDEEKNLRAGLESLLALDAPHKEVIVVDDRSTDHTPEILRSVARAHPELKIVTIASLPEGWLGKNNALQQGANAATGDFLLFTDADVVMEPTVVRRALRYVSEHQLDHLAIGPAALMPGVLLNMFMVGFTIFFNLFTKPWRVRDSKSKAHVGIGAFNLIRRSAYEKMGGHSRIALRPDDDLKLGKLVKLNGHRSDFLVGAPLIQVEWYATIPELVHGLEKNMYAGCDYKLSLVMGGAIAQIWLFLWPVIALFVSPPTARLVYAVTLVVLWLIAVGAARAQRLSGWYALGLPLASAMFVFLMVRNTLLNLRDGGIRWRGTFYSLAELKKNAI